MKKIYLAKYSMGHYDDYREINVFASHDKDLVEKWIEKFNSKLEVWKNYFSQFSNQYSIYCLDEKYYNKINGERFDAIVECNRAFIEELEIK
jgi:hypothetical protein